MTQRVILSTEDKLKKVEVILKYYRLRGANKEKLNSIKNKLLSAEQDEKKP